MDKIVSFIVPAYNAAPFLEKCLSSFLHEQRKQENIEVIIVNDGSTDKTSEIAQRFTKERPDLFRLLEKPNGGHGSVINIAVPRAQGKFIKIIDADDWIENNSLESYVNFLEKSNADVVLTSFSTFDIVTHKKQLWEIPSQIIDEFTMEYVMKHWESLSRYISFHGITYLRNFYRKNNILLSEKIFYEDLEYATVPFCCAHKIQIARMPLYCYRIGDINQSVSDVNQVKRIRHLEIVLLWLFDYFERNKKSFTSTVRLCCLSRIDLVLTIWFVTTLLRDQNRSKGRKQAREMLKSIKSKHAYAFSRIHKKYLILLILNYLHVNSSLLKFIFNNKLLNFAKSCLYKLH